MIDLCSGLKGASAAMREHGWTVISLDIDPEFKPDIIADVRKWYYEGPKPDLIWASPPCNEFSREFFIWSRTGKTPDLSIYQACKRIIYEANPRFWVIENVRGAVSYFGKYSAVYYPYYLWGFFPPLPDIKLEHRYKESLSSLNKAERALIPYKLSYLIASTIEKSHSLFELNIKYSPKGY